MTERPGVEQFAKALFYGVVLLLVYLAFRVFEPFLVALGWAGVLAVIFHPLQERLERRWGGTRAAAASTTGVTLILIVPALLLLILFVREGVIAGRSIQQAFAAGQLPMVERIWEAVVQRVQGTATESAGASLPAAAQQITERVATFLASQAGAVVRNLAVFVFELFVTLFALFYFFRDADALMAGLRRLIPFGEPHRERMLAEARDLIHASVTTSLLIAGVQGLLGGIGFVIVGLGTPFFWGVVIAFFSLLPVVGGALIWVPAALWLVVTGHAVRAIILVAICAGLAGTADNLLRPVLLSGRTRMNGLVVFISIAGGISVFGMLGIVLGPIVVATLASFLEVYSQVENSG
jgi:predicted PurR-regulated permease PerM